MKIVKTFNYLNNIYITVQTPKILSLLDISCSHIYVQFLSNSDIYKLQQRKEKFGYVY